MEAGKTGITYKALWRTAWLSALSPSLLLVTIISFAIHVRISLGHWPKPMWENYEAPLAAAHETLMVVVLFFTLFAAPVIWLVAAVWSYAKGAFYSAAIKQFFVYVAGWVLIVAAGSVDPTTFTEWLLD